MTLIVSYSHSHDYVVMTGDSSAYEMRDDDDKIGTPVDMPPLAPKTYGVTNRVLAGVGGCVLIGLDFRQRLASKVTPDDDLDACVAAAREVIAELEEVDPDLAETEWAVEGREMTRCSIKDGMFTITMAGFRRDGTTALFEYQHADDVGFREASDPGRGEFACACPLGIPMERVIPYYERFYGGDGLPLRNVLINLMTIHSELGLEHPDRVTRDVNGSVLLWRDDEPEFLTFTVDRDDLDGFMSVHTRLQEIKEER